ncbi:hypothetical protein DFQ12_2995 [Sphingobacterium detergens]|uniref:Uncharacterized protein n=1 Tax=Sphingobacterium detergens TaxID=1145106 RepID=A0A420B7I0_SPHD1|nr:hypothetical protein DFQ12_2995 [Sphingobacterium detergens]
MKLLIISGVITLKIAFKEMWSINLNKELVERLGKEVVVRNFRHTTQLGAIENKI